MNGTTTFDFVTIPLASKADDEDGGGGGGGTDFFQIAVNLFNGIDPIIVAIGKYFFIVYTLFNNIRDILHSWSL